MNDWKSYTDVNGDFQLANFLYKSINELMKNSLDMGTLLSNDQYKLRAYKEQTKKLFKNKWLNIADALEYFDILEKCVCYVDRSEPYCDICKGSRYKISSYLSPDEMREVSTFVNAMQDSQIQEKLQKGLMKLLEDIS
jgi:hypothetical protein